MIPRHRPPFGIAGLTRAMLPGSGGCHVTQLEQDYAAALGVPHAVWLPSARYGICHSLTIGLAPQEKVYCPAFTCGVVHEAVRRSSRSMSLVDTDEDDLLMDRRFLNLSETPSRRSDQVSMHDSCANVPGYGVVLSEVFGYRYRLPEEYPFLRNAGLRIFDMAMCIPTPEDMQRLVKSDVALISFGLGKSLYAGWGGMAFTRNREMAEALRERRDQDASANPGSAQTRRIAAIWLRTIAHSPWLYQLCRKAADSRSMAADRSESRPNDLELQSAEWCSRPAPFHLKLVGENLRRSAVYRRKRIDLAGVYRTELSQITGEDSESNQPWLTLLPDDHEALSHFCVCVPPSLRSPLRDYLWSRGFDTAALFPFPEIADATDLPRTRMLTQQIIGLPLSGDLSGQHVRRLCSEIREYMATHAAAGNVAGRKPGQRLPTAA
ncbi:MAG: DegT/DnrJ/EryC1/StrS family aminotransferase [Planctomyces sp.]|jgi:dTDP-4-amino-4,6-dideoxygalactose transaminase